MDYVRWNLERKVQELQKIVEERAVLPEDDIQGSLRIEQKRNHVDYYWRENEASEVPVTSKKTGTVVGNEGRTT